MIAIFYVDDAGIAARDKRDVDKLITSLESKGFELTREGTFSEFLGIKFTQNPDGTKTLTQKGLIKKIIEATGMENSNPNWTPSSTTALGMDPEGPDMKETWGYSSIIGMLLYLTTNTCPDIALAVSQVARFSHAPKQSHATAVKTIIRYLSRTRDQGMIVRPAGHLHLDAYVDADFAGLYRADPDRAPTSSRSRTGYIVFLGNCPLIWKSQLQTATSLSTQEAEYGALSACMRTIIPLRSLLLEVTSRLTLPHELRTSISCTVFEDNAGACALANNQQITNRTKYYLCFWHHFWDNVRRGDIKVVKIDTHNQRADYLTKGLPRKVFEKICKLAQGW